MVVLDFLNCNFKISSFGTLDVAHDTHEHEHSHAHDAYTDNPNHFLQHNLLFLLVTRQNLKFY